jgi:hypothetical protein
MITQGCSSANSFLTTDMKKSILKLKITAKFSSKNIYLLKGHFSSIRFMSVIKMGM